MIVDIPARRFRAGTPVVLPNQSRGVVRSVLGDGLVVVQVGAANLAYRTRDLTVAR